MVHFLYKTAHIVHFRYIEKIRRRGVAGAGLADFSAVLVCGEYSRCGVMIDCEYKNGGNVGQFNIAGLCRSVGSDTNKRS